ncbi:DUF5686 and carboxypeptidase-like regulatory domain-containing protein [Flavobacterium sp. UBA6135]|uniref:DUF5686 and carboxypeptidase-like regulatory domain-containing protein n=1 Tax=Flavobacterium sp. UBA6135 TaxID=1946553 RepID=UPI0025B873E5|nr:DUF5686 and carboxypeptidase-like regulatory domain-containing protein [Flavobacterium sp. UBA6135]
MKFKGLLFLFLLVISSVIAQTKVSGVVLDEFNQPIPFANVYFKNSSEGLITNENGRFYLESQKSHTTLVVSFIGFTTVELPLTKSVTYDIKVNLAAGETLREVVLISGKMSKKNNPAIDILRKIWARKKQNGLRQFKHYQYDKYEKVEFDLNTIDSAMMKSKLFKGMEFVFEQMDTSRITGKTYLPIFINESISEVYGNNTINKEKEILKANKNSGFNTNQQIIAFIKDLYAEYDIYDNYLKFFDKDFVSPLSRTGIDVYNYALTDSMYIDNKWCYNIVYYPRRKGELTFKGDFWVNDTTFAIKSINMAVTKSANINWVKEIYIEQEFDVVNDSVFLLKRDHMMSDFAFNKKEESKGVYGKRTTLFKNHAFNQEKPKDFYKEEVNFIDNSVYAKSDDFWQENRFESLSKDELGVYKMLDTLQTVKKFKQMYNLVSILGSGYIQKGNFDFGPIFSTIGYNEVEGVRLRVGGRTYFGQNDPWRLQFYTAYGFEDNQMKYGLSGKVLINKKNRLILEAGNRRDIEQIGASLTTSNNVLGRSFASSGLFMAGSNTNLTSINLSMMSLNIEPVKNLTLETGMSYRTLKSASSTFSLDYFTDDTFTTTASEVTQSEFSVSVDYTPKRKTIGYGVERSIVDSPYSRLFVNYSQGVKGVFDSDFDYQKLQLYFKQPILVGGFGRLNVITEVGKTFGDVPLGLMSVVPGNQSYFLIENTFNNLNFYEFVTDQYATFQLEHHFLGRILSRVPGLRKMNLREVIGIKGVVGSVSDSNRNLNASNLIYLAPEKPYWEYSAGIGNIFKVFRIDFSWRGNYRDLPDANNFAVKGSFGFYF